MVNPEQDHLHSMPSSRRSSGEENRAFTRSVILPGGNGSGMNGHGFVPASMAGASAGLTAPLSQSVSDLKNSIRSMPGSRRTSGDEERFFGRAGLPANFGSVNAGQNFAQRVVSHPLRRGPPNDLSSVFDQLNIGTAGTQRTPSAGSALPNSLSGQRSQLGRELPRPGSGDQNRNVRMVNPTHHGNTFSEHSSTPFNAALDERLLADIEAEDSEFVRKYNLADDKFAALEGRLEGRDGYPGALSASSAALDLAPLSQTPPRNARGGDGPTLSEWPRFVPRGPDGSSFRKQQSGPDGMPQGMYSSMTSAAGPYGFPLTSEVSSARNSPSPSGFMRRPKADLSLSAARLEDLPLPRGSDSNGLGQSGNGANGMSSSLYNLPSASYGMMLGGGGGDGSGNSPVGSGILRKPTGELDTATRIEDLQGDIFPLCKDQHGCRYLQKKLEEGVPSARDIIFKETFRHFADLMIDPFGNYLCQKMLEYCTDEQRDLIVESVAGDLVAISLNMHGTRAVQKTIDYLSTQRQISSIIVALSMSVVTLIKDLNGNHVIQKCLNRLNSEDNQFIYNAVAQHCVEVATHRHGCCVLQRCIDHASDQQRIQLVTQITFNALTLVQDPFGNYVVQYVLDLNDQRFSDAIVRQFVGSVCLLSLQKFSSNVIEKCIRVSEPSTRRQLVEELLNRQRLEKLLRDSFGNYVVQTSLDYAEPNQRQQLVDCIRPILPMIRNTPYGKRIQSKLQRDNVDLGPASGSMPFSLLQAAAYHQQQLQAIAAMANRPPAEFGNRPYNGGGPGMNNGHGPNGHGPGNVGGRGIPPHLHPGYGPDPSMQPPIYGPPPPAPHNMGPAGASPTLTNATGASPFPGHHQAYRMNGFVPVGGFSGFPQSFTPY
ncbi:unnamed protein product [Tilletia laevis]|uniref:Uncharacterized protein n=2 Tax=Tilletia TaxID=13289 RepID=A0A9N8M3L6_9BASI|nr:hypothetical protein CF336_g1124 [Tilletia laevis]KAE8263167.1 hypothetical protein A4X03_0g1885 [Tilletia caries]KAE8206717.1 hypothetical protein CF335_g1664 [Tilletia laevis]CAD6885757.1 unnamed protein product [Tilletia caries]CAD6903199.1 unnamed protein product [Tilletia laevis]